MVLSRTVKENGKKKKKKRAREKEKGIFCAVILTAYGNAMVLYFFLMDTP